MLFLSLSCVYKRKLWDLVIDSHVCADVNQIFLVASTTFPYVSFASFYFFFLGREGVSLEFVVLGSRWQMLLPNLILRDSVRCACTGWSISIEKISKWGFNPLSSKLRRIRPENEHFVMYRWDPIEIRLPSVAQY